MQGAPWPAGLLFGLSLALVILLAGPLLLFNPWFTAALQARHEVAASFATTQAEIDRVTGAILLDLYVDGPFDASLDGNGPLLDEDERSHMSDVSRLVRLLAAITLVAVILAAVMGVWLRGDPRRQGRIMLLAAGGIGTAAILLAVIFAIAFEPAFLAFHAIFFPPGTYLFEEGSELILLFPRGFWFDAALAAGVVIVLSALIVGVAGMRRWHHGG